MSGIYALWSGEAGLKVGHFGKKILEVGQSGLTSLTSRSTNEITSQNDEKVKENNDREIGEGKKEGEDLPALKDRVRVALWFKRDMRIENIALHGGNALILDALFAHEAIKNA